MAQKQKQECEHKWCENPKTERCADCRELLRERSVIDFLKSENDELRAFILRVWSTPCPQAVWEWMDEHGLTEERQRLVK